MLDWSTCKSVERVPGRVSGAWVFKGTRLPVKTLFENLEAGASVNDFLAWFEGVTREQVLDVLHHAEQSLAAGLMRILFDQGTPVPLRHAFAGHEVTTT